jgi:N-acyl-D-aspartate/D-glutamate deacylase
MLDHVIRGAKVMDGSGSAGKVADVGIRDGMIAAIGDVDEAARTEFDADGLVLTPGFIDPHTHYDAQLMWDGSASPSNLHGVTTTINGNCGFTLAPAKPQDLPYLLQMLSVVEGMSLSALEQGVTFEGGSFTDYVDGLEGHLSLNAGFMVGHSALRHYVMGDNAVGGVASPEEIEKMAQLLEASLAAGGLGFSTSKGGSHVDHLDRPVASRAASRDEILRLCQATTSHPGTVIELTMEGVTTSFDEEAQQLLIDMSLAGGGKPVNWNQMVIWANDEDRVRGQMMVSRKARSLGGHVTGLTLPTPVANAQSFLFRSGLHRAPGIAELFKHSVPERIEMLRNQELRTKMAREAEAAGTSQAFAGPLTHWGRYKVTTFSPQNAKYSDRMIEDIAKERGEDLFDTLAEIVIADELRTILWPVYPESQADRELKVDLWKGGDLLFGGSDAGAHVDRLCGTTYITDFLAGSASGEIPLPLEQAVYAMSGQLADFFGLQGRGRIHEGAHADVVLFDPEKVGSTEPTIATDLPGGDSYRIMARANGIVKVLVNGVETVNEGQPTGATPGSVIKSAA